mmetsp:Transcript_4904/g.6474  ORF Transcript_4904/g.6474 Transcript_4904/m.6474 type:complete len:88 (-) Transcript_4904:5-268(-)
MWQYLVGVIKEPRKAKDFPRATETVARGRASQMLSSILNLLSRTNRFYEEYLSFVIYLNMIESFINLNHMNKCLSNIFSPPLFTRHT